MLQEYSVITNLPYEQTLAALEGKLAEIKFGILCKIDIPQRIRDKGLAYSEQFTVLEICNPAEALGALEKNLKAAYFLPCKLLVHNQGGRGAIGLLKPSSLIRELDDPELDALARRIEEKLIAVMDQLA